ncbi:MAG: metallophosphoesterase [Euryarchaeota archaeon]|nr:metallophosphoesterase [Euryarchaeota archaeon]
MNGIKLLPGLEITREGGAWLPESGTYVVADLHLGYEAAARREGAGMPSVQREVIMRRLGRIVERYSPDRFIVNGDLKHTYDRNLRQEWDEILEIIWFLRSSVKKVDVLRGNHDNFLATILSREGIKLKNSAKVAGIAFAHGHETVKRSGWLVIGHEHPFIKTREPLGAGISLPCFLWSRKLKMVVLPPLSPIAFGRNVLPPEAEPLSPMIESFSSFEAAAMTEKGLLRFGKVAALGAMG